MEDKSGLYIVAIVGVVAIVALVVLLTGGNRATVAAPAEDATGMAYDPAMCSKAGTSEYWCDVLSSTRGCVFSGGRCMGWLDAMR